MSAQSSQLFPSLCCFAFNGDRSKVAMCPQTTTIYVYATKGSQNPADWVKEHELGGQHDQMVTGIDWAPKTNRIVTCAQDRNAYVWSFDDKKNTWTPTLVMLRTDRAATCVRWCPSETKFAVGTAASTALVCFFEADNDWWVSKPIRRGIESSVRSVAWHPNSLLLAVASTDNHCRVFSAFVDGIDNATLQKAASEHPSAGGLVSGKKFGECVHDSVAKGWVHAVAWSKVAKDCTELAFVSHDSSISVVDVVKNSSTSVKVSGLPFCALDWLSADKIVAGGFDYVPYLFEKKGAASWAGRKLESGKAKTGETASATRAAFARFQSQASTGQASPTESKEGDASVHDNVVVGVNCNGEKEFATAGLDGRIAVWTV